MHLSLTVTGNNEELVVIADLVGGHIWESCNDLLFRRKVCALLEFKIAKRSAQSQVAVDTSEVDESTSSTDTGLFALILWLVVERKWFRTTLNSKDRSRVAGVALSRLAFCCGNGMSCRRAYDVDLVLCDDAHGRSATGYLFFVLWICRGIFVSGMIQWVNISCASCIPLKIARSMARKPSFSACSKSLLLNDSCLATILCRCSPV